MVVLAVLLAIVAVGTFLPARVANATLVAAIVLGIAIWIVGENFGALFTNGATDVNSGPLLVLLSISYWRRAADPAPEGV
jgi:lipopolysaccharide export LptBFGC system permease protein LptF